MRKALKIVGWAFAIQVGLLVVWTAWNLRHSLVSLVLIEIAIAAAVGAVALSLRTRKNVAVPVGAVVLAATWLALHSLTDELGSLTWLTVYLLFSLSFVSASVLTVGIVRLLMCIGPVTKHGLTVLGGLIVALWTFVVPASILNHYTVWYFMLPAARLTVDGKLNAGYIHWAEVGSNGGAVMVTVRQRSQSQTYRIWRPDTQATPPERHMVGQPTVQHCEGWSAPRSPAFSTGDVNPPCSYFFDDKPTPNPPERNAVGGPNSVEFTADDRKRVRAEW
jgi:hypothetical protein